MTRKRIWEGKPASFHIHSGEDDGYVSRHAGRETIDNKDGTFTQNEVFENFLPKFQGDLFLFSKDEDFIGEIEFTCEHYDYVVHLYDVIMVEQRERGGLEITINLQSSAPKTNDLDSSEDDLPSWTSSDAPLWHEDKYADMAESSEKRRKEYREVKEDEC